MESFMPLNKRSFETLTKEQIRIIDQFLFRFEKLHDAVGNKLFKAVLMRLGEDVEEKPFIDMLNRLEKLTMFNDIEGWFDLRQMRNELSHEYEDDAEESSEIIHKIHDQKDRLISYFKRIDDYYTLNIDKAYGK